MARVLVCEPVHETRFLIERVVERMGHELVPDDAAQVDVLVYEPASVAGAALARGARRQWPGLVLIACSVMPPRASITGPDADVHLEQPFAPADVRGALHAALHSLASRASSTSSL